MSQKQFSDEAIDRLARDIGRKLQEKRGMVEASEGPFTIKVIPKGDNFDIKVSVTG